MGNQLSVLTGGASPTQIVGFTALATFCALTGYILNLMRLRKRDYDPRFPALKMESYFWGNLKHMGEATGAFPPGAHSNYFFKKMFQDNGMPPWLRFDVRPFSNPVIVIRDGPLCDTVVKAKGLKGGPGAQKSPDFMSYHQALGLNSMLLSGDEDWKIQRKRYSYGFQPQHLKTLIPAFGERMKVLGDAFEKFAEEGRVVNLLEYFTRLTFDIIGIVAADIQFDILSQPESLDEMTGFGGTTYADFRRLTATYDYDDDLLKKHDPVIRAKRWWYARKWDAACRKVVQENTKGGVAPRSILGLALNSNPQPSIQNMADNLKAFIFGGHDTTAIVGAWAFYHLARSPAIRARYLEEVETFFPRSPGISDSEYSERILSEIGESPERNLFKMPYVDAIIKEALRLYPPAGASRWLPHEERDKFSFTYKDHKLDISGNVLYCSPFHVQTSPEFWGPDAEEFKPERWLESKERKAEMESSPWFRPFERGSRACIGQQMAVWELCMLVIVLGWRWEFELVEKKRPMVTRQITAKPVGGILVRLREVKKV